MTRNQAKATTTINFAAGTVAGMGALVAVFVGGGVGSALRYAANTAAANAGFGSHMATGSVNVIGALLLGFATGWFASNSSSDPVKLGLTTGLLGGFTTFSAFMVESTSLIQNGRILSGIANLLLPVTVGLLAAALGIWAGRSLQPS